MKVQSAFPLTLIFLAAMGLSCGDFDDDDFYGEHDRDREFGPGHKPNGGPTRNGPACDGGTIVVVVQAPDSGEVVPNQDAGVEPDANVEPPDAGGCPEEGCACRRDTDCPSDQVCNHAIGRCEPPPVWCTDITVEAECVARTDCQAIYAGMNCTDANGGECVSGDENCTCEIFSFAACIIHP